MQPSQRNIVIILSLVGFVFLIITFLTPYYSLSFKQSGASADMNFYHNSFKVFANNVLYLTIFYSELPKCKPDDPLCVGSQEAIPSIQSASGANVFSMIALGIITLFMILTAVMAAQTAKIYKIRAVR